MPRYRRRLAAAICVVLLAAIATPEAAAEEGALRLLHAASPKSTAHMLFLRPWAQRLKALSGGRLKIEIEPRPPEDAARLFDALGDGDADIVWASPGLSPGRFPATEVFELPFMAGSAEAVSQAAFDVVHKGLEAEYEGLHVILLHAGAPAWLHTARVPVRRLEDLHGLSIHAPTPQARAALAAWGAAPVALATPDEVRAALESGRIDGTLMSFEAAFPAGVIAATRFHTRPARLPGLASSLYLLAMNKVRYEGLPGDLRQLIDESAGRDLAGRVGRSWDSVERLNIKRSRGEGHVFYKLGEAETARWRIAARPVIESWTGELDAAGMDGAALLAVARAAIARYEVIREVE